MGCGELCGIITNTFLIGIFIIVSQVSFVQTLFSQETSVNGRILSRLIVIEIAGLIQFLINSWQQEYGL